MHSPLLLLSLFLLLLFILIIITEVMYRYLKISAEKSRKFLHVSGGLFCLLLPSFFNSHWWVLILAAAAFILLLITYLKKMLPSIHLTQRRSIGSVIFPIPVYICFLIAEIKHNDLFFYLPISLLAIADTAAEIGGNQWGYLSRQFFNGQKTLIGSLSFFIAAFIICFAWLFFGYHYPIVEIIEMSLLIALLSCVAELFTLHGWDNLSVPAVTLILLEVFL